MVLLVFFGIFGALAFRIRMFISHLLLRNTHLQQARVQQVRRSRADCSDPLQPCTLGLRDLALRVLFQSVILPPHPIYNVCLHWPLGLSHRSLSSLRLFLFPRFIFFRTTHLRKGNEKNHQRAMSVKSAHPGGEEVVPQLLHDSWPFKIFPKTFAEKLTMDEC